MVLLPASFMCRMKLWTLAVPKMTATLDGETADLKGFLDCFSRPRTDQLVEHLGCFLPVIYS